MALGTCLREEACLPLRRFREDGKAGATQTRSREHEGAGGRPRGRDVLPFVLALASTRASSPDDERINSSKIRVVRTGRGDAPLAAIAA